jgi:hypothetical protein
MAQFDVYPNPSPRSRDLLRKPVMSLAAHAGELRDALDAVISGV